MGCNCKQVEKLQKTQLFATKNERIGVLNRLNAMGINFFNKLIVVLLFVILTPIVIIVLIFSFLFKGDLILPLPKFMAKHLEKMKEDE